MAGPKITLDTNLVIYALDRCGTPTPIADVVRLLIRSGLDGKIDIAITTRVESDLRNDKDELRRDNMLRLLKSFPVIPTVARWGVSSWGNDLWSGPGIEYYSNKVTQSLFPDLSVDARRFGNKISDIDHLTGHLLAKRDIFVTNDTQILRCREKLRNAVGIVVMHPSECLTHLGGQSTLE